MGLFSFVGKALKGVAKVAGFIPGIGGIVGKAAGLVGGLLDSKQPMGTTATKTRIMLANGGRSTSVLRGKSSMNGGMLTASVLRSSPVMPGGAVSSPQGIMASGGGAPPLAFGGGSSGGKRRKRRKAASSTRKRRKAKLKFGSAAWRKRYMPKRRRAA